MRWYKSAVTDAAASKAAACPMTTQVCWSPTLTIVSIAAVQHDFFAVASRLALAGARSMRIAVEGVTTELPAVYKACNIRTCKKMSHKQDFPTV